MSGSTLEVIKSYLVSLGFSVDKNSYDTANKVIESAGESLAKFAGDTVKNFGLAGATVTTFLATAAVGMGKFLSDLGEAQIQYEMLARQMWTTTQQAEAFDTTLKAMGVSLQELYLSPTLMKQYQELHAEAFQMMPPSDFQQQISLVQDITFQFKSMKLEATYALQWIGYYFIKYMQGPLETIRQDLQNINDSVIKGMPSWTNVIAQVMVFIAQLFGTVVQTFEYAWKAITDLFNMIPNNVKEVGAVFLALGALIMAGPYGIIVGLILLLNDFYTYLKGGQSEFAPLWAGIVGFYDRLKNDGAITAFKKGLQDAFNFVSNVISGSIKVFKAWFTDLKELVTGLYNQLVQNGTIKGFESDFKAVMKGVSDAIKGAEGYIVDFYTTIRENGTLSNIWTSLADILSILQEDIQHLIEFFQSFFSVINQSGIIKTLFNSVMQLVGAIGQLIANLLGMDNQMNKFQGLDQVFKLLGKVLGDTVLVVLEAINNTIISITDGIKSFSDLLQGKWGQAWKNFSNALNWNMNPNTKPQSYIYPSNNNTNTNNNQQLTVQQTNNIYGSDATSTAKAATSNLQDLIYRNVQGVIL